MKVEFPDIRYNLILIYILRNIFLNLIKTILNFMEISWQYNNKLSALTTILKIYIKIQNNCYTQNVMDKPCVTN